MGYTIAPHGDEHLRDTKQGPSLGFTFGGEVRFGFFCATQDYQGRSLASDQELSGTPLASRSVEPILQ
jgi:hypothetical protein